MRRRKEGRTFDDGERSLDIDDRVGRSFENELGRREVFRERWIGRRELVVHVGDAKEERIVDVVNCGRERIVFRIPRFRISTPDQRQYEAKERGEKERTLRRRHQRP